MKALLPFLSLYRSHLGQLLFGIVLAITSLAASIGLLSLSGWFLAASALVGSSLLFNFFYPSSGVRGLAIGRTISRYFERLVTHDGTFRVLANLRVTIFRKLIPLTPAGLSRYRNSELLNRLVSDVDTLDTLYLNLISPFVSAVMIILFMAIGLSFISPLLAFVICGSLAVLLLIFPLLFYRLGRKLGNLAIQSRANYRSQFIEWIQLNGEFLLFGVQAQATDRLNQTEKTWLFAQSRESQLAGLSNAMLVALNGLLVTVVIYLSATAINVPSADSPEALIALVVFCTLASLEILSPIGIAFLHLGQIITAAERLNEITQQRPLVTFNGTEKWQKIEKNQPLVRFDKVSFSYPERTEVVLDQITFEINAGEKIAILGKTGSGKSTIFQLLVRNYDNTSGQILLNNCKITNYPEQVLRTHIVALTQRVHIFSATIKDNLLMGNPQASEAELYKVLAKVELSYLTEQEGLDLWLGDGGRPLSGGEQRRLGLARLLLSKAEIILLDEPTEGLDRETEQHILQCIFEHCLDKTLLMITHRLNGMDHFDRVYQIDNGKML
ncbi:cysteine/glutathione ABC transporter ATP-binding protein/permease CydC [Vespertiliibacter pulmonis]|uniref:Glutathione/L-cysteine transport system ATP-binding/permease protein CydC n=1 Tax=Vespertiliibacter pulmonis TaxID=1443036 RepID=A0A3N4VRS0_9PAST|nr:cysteine/glutathione ABC transporter ATP-binding protein/permease CydC [Vespertiliibacter pulmonis]QLB21385.1 cysteine/glutathione ABC transporter ATP-binding protein/permease CydC [Vespertiliibacter pulmonis]RPE85796.1 ATP-binding cassette subfamily C protein CydC [Vespertiliibacter pulmonis]